MKSKYVKLIAEAIKLHVKDISYQEIEDLIEIPPTEINYNYAFPCFQLAKYKKKAPKLIAEDLESKLMNKKWFKEVKALGPYLNFQIAFTKFCLTEFA